MEIEEEIIEELGYNKESYEAYAAQEDIVAAIHKAQQYERERCIQKAKKACCYVCKHIDMNTSCFVDPTTKECRRVEEIRKAISQEE